MLDTKKFFVHQREVACIVGGTVTEFARRTAAHATCMQLTVTTPTHCRLGGVSRQPEIPLAKPLIQAKSAGRRRKTVRTGKGEVTAGHIPLLAKDNNVQLNERYILPARQPNNSTKRTHSLQKNSQKGLQNGCKW